MSDTSVDIGSELNPELIFEFDFRADPLLRHDVHEGYLQLREKAPTIFWTPAHGGHWVVLDARSVRRIMRDSDTFSNRDMAIPAQEHEPLMIPGSLDKPEHLAYRRLLSGFFEPAAIARLEERARTWAGTLISKLAENGTCEFVEATASRLPVYVFMEMAGFSLDRFDEFRGLVTAFFEGDPEKMPAAVGQIFVEIDRMIEEHRQHPQDDLISKLLVADFEGRELRHDELQAIMFHLFLAGLDTVTNALTFSIRHLAGDHALQDELTEHPERIPDFVEEMLRRYTFVAMPRRVAKDVVIGSASMKKDDRVLCVLPMVGLDPELNPDPLAVKTDRENRHHAAFGYGAHVCLGRHLALMEMRIFIEQWLSRIGRFEVDMSTPLTQPRAGNVMCIPALRLAWEGAAR